MGKLRNRNKDDIQIVNIVLQLIWYLKITKRARCCEWSDTWFIQLSWNRPCVNYDRKFQIFIFVIGHIDVNKGVFCLIISYLRIKSYNVLNYNYCSTDWSFPFTVKCYFLRHTLWIDSYHFITYVKFMGVVGRDRMVVGVSSNTAHDSLYSEQHYVIKFSSDFRQVSGFLRVSGSLH